MVTQSHQIVTLELCRVWRLQPGSPGSLGEVSPHYHEWPWQAWLLCVHLDRQAGSLGHLLQRGRLPYVRDLTSSQGAALQAWLHGLRRSLAVCNASVETFKCSGPACTACLPNRLKRWLLSLVGYLGNYLDSVDTCSCLLRTMYSPPSRKTGFMT